MSAYEFEIPTGEVSRRLHGVKAELLERSSAALLRSKEPDLSVEFAAALRGKARGLREAADVIRALEQGRPIPRRHFDLLTQTPAPSPDST